MAFHPIHFFRKHDKFFMASLILVSMVTFVFCSGSGGDLWTWISGWLISRRGSEVARISGHSWYDADLHKIREERNIANEFMRKAAEDMKNWWEFEKRKIEESSRESKTNNRETKSKAAEDERQRKIGLITAVLADLNDGLEKPRYFDGGTKLDDLVEFILWQQQADKLGINLAKTAIDAEVLRAIHADVSGQGGWQYRGVQMKVRESHPSANDDTIWYALNREFRARIARLTLLGSYPQDLYTKGALDESQAMQVRMPLSPDQLWDYYQKNVSGYQVAMLPVSVADFMSKVPEPTEEQLRTLFEERRRIKYDPTSATSGFELPMRSKIAWAAADPDSKYYRDLARTLLTLQETPPTFFTPMLPGLGEAIRYAEGAVVMRAFLEQDYENIKATNPMMRERFLVYPGFLPRGELSLPLTDPYFDLPVYTETYRPKPAEAAAVVAAALDPVTASVLPGITSSLAPAAMYQSAAYFGQKDELRPAIEAMSKQRAPVGLTVLLSASGPTPLLAATEALAISIEPQWLPLDAVRGELMEMREGRMAREWVGKVMQRVKQLLDLDRGVPEGFKARMALLQKQFPGLEVHETKGFVNQFNVAEDSNLKGLLQSYERYYNQINLKEGRGGTEKMLKEDDFYKLFFGQTESHSIYNAAVYAPAMWPPVVKVPQTKVEQVGSSTRVVSSKEAASEVDFWRDASMPILFWKTTSEPPHVPDSLAEVRERVREAWKMQEARKLALPVAEKAAEKLKALQVGGGDYLPAMRKEAANLNTEVKTLDEVSPLQVVNPNPLAFKKYELPRGWIVNPQPDTSKHVLEMDHLEKPLKTGPKELDDANKKLFAPDIASGKVHAKQIQILTNKDESVFYVTAVTYNRRPELAGLEILQFQAACRESIGRFTPWLLTKNSLVQYAEDGAAEDFRRRLLDQLRSDADVKIENRGSFDQEGGS